MAVEELHSKGLFPFSPKALLKAIEAVEFCYDEKEGMKCTKTKYFGTAHGAFNVVDSETENSGLTMFDEDYINYVKRKEEQKERQKEEERQQRESRKLELVSSEDDVLIEVLLELLQIESALKKSASRLAKRMR